MPVFAAIMAVGMVAGTVWQAADGANDYNQLQDALQASYEAKAKWEEKYEALFSSTLTLQIQLDTMLTDLAILTAELRENTQITVKEINSKAITINWLWIILIIIFVLILILKRYNTGKILLDVINYPFVYLFTLILNGFLYLFGLDLYKYPDNPFVEKQVQTGKYNFKINNKKYNTNYKLFYFMVIIILISIVTVILTLKIQNDPVQKYYRDLYDDPTYKRSNKYSDKKLSEFKEKRKQKKLGKEFKFNKRYDTIYRCETFSKDLENDFYPCCNKLDVNGDAVATCPYEEKKCKYVTKGYTIASNSDNPSEGSWVPPKGVEGETVGEYVGPVLFASK